MIGRPEQIWRLRDEAFAGQNPGLAFPASSEKQENNRSGFIAVAGFTAWNVLQHQSGIRPQNRAGTGLEREGRLHSRTASAPGKGLNLGATHSCLAAG